MSMSGLPLPVLRDGHRWQRPRAEAPSVRGTGAQLSRVAWRLGLTLVSRQVTGRNGDGRPGWLMGRGIGLSASHDADAPDRRPWRLAMGRRLFR